MHRFFTIEYKKRTAGFRTEPEEVKTSLNLIGRNNSSRQIIAVNYKTNFKKGLKKMKCLCTRIEHIREVVPS